MRLLLILAAAPLAASATAAPAPPSAYPQVRQLFEKRDCQGRADVHPAAPVRQTKPLTSQRLGEMPPGQLILAVQRQVDDCPVPVIVGQPYGFDPRGLDGSGPRR